MPTLHEIMKPKPFPPFMHEKFILPQNIDIESLDYSAIEHYCFTVKEMDKLGNQFHWMFDYSRNCFYYLSEDSGFFPKREFAFVPSKGYQCLIDIAHPDDVHYMLEIQREAYQFLCEQKMEDKINYKFTFKIKLLSTSGDYVAFNFQVKPIALDRGGNIWISLAQGVPSQTERLYKPLIIGTTDKSKVHTTNVKHPQKPYTLPTLTKREKEVLILLNQYKSANNICEILQFTSHTLKMHKKRLMLKLNAPNIQIVIENAGLLGLLKE